jgi:hypothetical protein
LAFDIWGRLPTGDLQDGRYYVDHVTNVVTQFPPGGNAHRPMSDERRRDAAFVYPGFVPAKGGVGGG